MPRGGRRAGWGGGGGREGERVRLEAMPREGRRAESGRCEADAATLQTRGQARNTADGQSVATREEHAPNNGQTRALRICQRCLPMMHYQHMHVSLIPAGWV